MGLSSTATKNIPEVDVDLEHSPRCGTAWVGYKRRLFFFRQILTDTWSRCENTAEWAGPMRCCGKTQLVCTPCREIAHRDGHFYCLKCRKNMRPPKWVRI